MLRDLDKPTRFVDNRCVRDERERDEPGYGKVRRATLATTDLERVRAVLAASYLPLRVELPHGVRSVQAKLDTTSLRTVTIGHLQFANETRIRTDEASNYHVNMQRTGRSLSGMGSRGEVQCQPGSAAVFSPGVAADLHWSPDTYKLCVMLDALLLRQELSALLGHEPTVPLVFAQAMDLRSAAAGVWTRVLALIEDETRRPAGVLSQPLIAARLELLLLDTLLHCQPHNYSDELSVTPPAAPRGTVQRALDLMHGRPEHPWSSRELAAEVGVSSRSLQAALRKATGMTPTSVLREIRLERAHADLARAEASAATVAEIARHWGFAHLGRFAGRYLARFGVHPSDTLRSEA
jgi:AraC-like DNA-binding protein